MQIKLSDQALDVSSKIDSLEAEMLKMPQVDCPVQHHFGPGVYIREVKLPAGSAVIGHYHKTSHLNTLVQGKLILINEDGTHVEREAPYTFVSGEGRKVAYIVEDVVFHNIFATDETDIDKLEETYLIKSETFLMNEAMQNSLLKLEHEPDREDFEMAIAQFGFNVETVRRISECEDDQVDMPDGVHPYRIMSSTIEGKGYFISAPAVKGTVLAPANIAGKRTPAGRYVNHSKKPNAKMLPGGDGNIYLIAIEDIDGCLGGGQGDEVTIDYRETIQLMMKLANKQGELLCQQ